MTKIRSLIACAFAFVLMIGIGVVATPSARAYSNSVQWQVGFSGTFNTIPSGGSVSGFWGWCVFGESSGSANLGTVGTDADCKVANYFPSSVGPVNPILISYDITQWVIGTGSAFLPPGTPGFFFTDGTLTLTGPGAAALGVPTHVPIPLSVPCSALPVTIVAPFDFSALAGGPCDSGIPAIPGHFSFHPAPGIAIEIQVVKVR